MKQRGPMLVVVLLAAGLAAAVSAVWNQHRQTHQALDFWGADVAHWIDTAPTVILIPLPSSAFKEGVAAHAAEPDALEGIDISDARGLIHFRRSILEDSNFDWSASPPPQEPNWRFAVRFGGEARWVTILFDLERGLVASKDAQGRVAALAPKTTRGLSQFFAEQLQQREP